MKKNIQFLPKLFIVSLFSVGAYAGPVGIEDFFKGKTAEESAAGYVKQIGFPRKVGSAMILEKAYVDNNDPTLVVLEMKSTNIAKEGYQNFFIDQQKYMEQKEPDQECITWKPFFDNGAKFRVRTKWADGKEFTDFIQNKENCKIRSIKR